MQKKNNGEPQRYSWGTQKKKKILILFIKKTNMYSKNYQREWLCQRKEKKGFNVACRHDYVSRKWSCSSFLHKNSNAGFQLGIYKLISSKLYMMIYMVSKVWGSVSGTYLAILGHRNARVLKLQSGFLTDFLTDQDEFLPHAGKCMFNEYSGHFDGFVYYWW